MSIRDKFKAAKVSSLKETRKDAESKSKANWGGGNRPQFHKVEEGRNVFKIAPPHNPNDPSMRPLRTGWLECEVPKVDDEGNEVGGTELKNKRIFCASVHSDLGIKDPIELYIEYARKQVNDEIDDKDERASKLAPITGFKDKKGKWHPGISPSTNYVVYAWDSDWNLGRVEFYPVIVKRMEELNIESDEEDGVMEVDCFSDPDSDVKLIIDWDKKGKTTADKWKINKSALDFSKYLKQYKKEGLSDAEILSKFQEDQKNEMPTDKHLEEFAEKESLTNLYKNVYTKRDFDLAVNGLVLFDSKNTFNIFENEEFIEELAKIEDVLPEKTEKQATNDGDDIEENFKKPVKTTKPKSTTPPKEKEGEDFDSWKPLRLKRYLKQYIIEMYGVDETLPEIDEATMVEWCKLAEAEEELPLDDYREQSDDTPQETEEETQTEDAPEEEKEEETTPPVNTKAMSKIEEIKARRAAAAKK